MPGSGRASMVVMVGQARRVDDSVETFRSGSDFLAGELQ